MNIVEAYMKFKGELIILISGLSGSGKTQLAKKIERDFKIKKIDIELYCKKDFDTKIKLPNGTTVVDWDDINSYDWTMINDTIEKMKTTGVVICGPYFPTSKLTITPNFHIHIKTSKQLLIETRKIYAQNNKDKCSEVIELEALIVNQLTYPHYLKYLEESKIDKYINTKELTPDQVYDQCADYLFHKIQEFLNEHNNGIKEIKGNNKNNDEVSSTTNSDSSITSDEEILLGTTHHEELEKQYY